MPENQNGQCVNWCNVKPRTLYRARRKHRLTERDLECLRGNCCGDGDCMPVPPDIPELEDVPLVVVNQEWAPLEDNGVLFPLPPEPENDVEKQRRWVAQQVGEGIDEFRWVQITATLGSTYAHTQAAPATTWTIDHYLDLEHPRFILFNTDGVEIVGTADWSASTANVLTVCFSLAVAGRALVMGD
jgi:hypothetical protein